VTRPDAVDSVTSSRLRQASSWLAGDHGRTLSQLWFVSVALSGLNFISTIVIVARTGATVFAEYTVALSLMTVGTALMDGGLASTFGMLAVDATAAGKRYQAFRALLAEYRLKILALGTIASLALAVFVGRNSAVFASGWWWAIVPFVAVSAAMARSSQLNSLLYARGRFRSYGVVMLAPPVLRMCLVIAVVSGFGSFTLPTLFVITLASPLLGLVWAEIAVNREALPPDAAPGIGSSERREVAEFLAPTATSVILSGITFQLTAVGGSFYAGGPAIATYGVFMRANTIVSMLFGPTSQYVGRHLRAKGAVPSRNALENRYLLLTVLAFVLYACVSLIVYHALGLRYAHYALGQTRAYAVFVFYSGLGCLQLALDGILAARGRARHRVPGTVMLCLLNAVLIPIVRPDTISSLVLIDATSMLSIVAYYWLELVLARRSLPVVQC
jgi:hypothetical protein